MVTSVMILSCRCRGRSGGEANNILSHEMFFSVCSIDELNAHFENILKLSTIIYINISIFIEGYKNTEDEVS